MRFLHTSDWHLGRSFGPVSLLDHQRAFAEWFVALAREQSVDLVIIAGDVYDRSIPPVEAVELFDRTLAELQSTGAVVVVIAGNHDSAERVTVYDQLVAASGVHLRGGFGSAGQVITLQFADGPLDVVPLPYLDPALAPAGWIESPDHTGTVGETAGRLRRPSHQQVVAECIRRADVTSPRSIAVAHAFVVSGGLAPETSESERSLALGGSAAVEATVFDPFSYTALGHLHSPQVVGGHPVMRYSGTPLAYSFGELAEKSVVLGEMGPTGEVNLDTVPVPVGRRVATITGTLDDLLVAPRIDAVDRFVRARLTDSGPVLDAKTRLQNVYPHVVEVELRPDILGVGAGADSDDARRSLDPVEVATGYWTDLYGTEPSPDEVRIVAEVLLEASQR